MNGYEGQVCGGDSTPPVGYMFPFNTTLLLQSTIEGCIDGQHNTTMVIFCFDRLVDQMST